MFKVYDKVWVMQDNKPKKLIVFAVIESMNYWKTETEKFYRLVESRIDAGWGNNEGIEFREKDMFKTKGELINSLLIKD